MSRQAKRERARWMSRTHALISVNADYHNTPLRWESLELYHRDGLSPALAARKYVENHRPVSRDQLYYSLYNQRGK